MLILASELKATNEKMDNGQKKVYEQQLVN